MGLIFSSFRKSYLMKKIEMLQKEENEMELDFYKIVKHHKKFEKAFEDLLICMRKMDGYKEILQQYNTDAKELAYISDRILLAIDNYYIKGDYIPVAVLSFGRPLEYMLRNRDKILNYTFAEVREVLEVAIELL